VVDLPRYRTRIILLFLFGITMAYFEAAVVVYLRELYYPEGFAFPLRSMPYRIVLVEVGREAASMIMLAAVAGVVAGKFWDRFGYFLIMFGTWDIFYYVWLKVTLGWPSGLTDWDVLFLIPVPWLGPVIAPVLVSAVMIMIGLGVTRLYANGIKFRPTVFSWILGVIATIVILFTFMSNPGVTEGDLVPQQYMYNLLVAGLAFYLAGFLHAYKRAVKAAIAFDKGRH
jgi:hypothetical protein